MKLSALLLALCLLLAVAAWPAAVRAQEAAEESSEESSEASAAAESSEESSEASAAAESSEESSDEETASRNVESVPNVGGGKVTLVSNKNTLTHIASAPKVINHFAMEEQERKSQAEQKLKRTDEQAIKKKQEVAEKDAKSKEMKAKAVLEAKQKEALREQSNKKLAEQKTKAQIALAKQKAEAQQKLAKTKEAAEKKDKQDRHRETQAKARQRAAEQRKKAHHANRRRAAEQRQKRTQIRLRGGWRNYHHSYEHATVNKWSRYCVAQGLVRGGPSLVGYMPNYCRPYHGRLIFALHRGRESRVDVLADGRIYYIKGASANWLSLNGMTFDTHVSHGLQLVHGWRSYGYGYRRVTQSNLGGLCAISGLIRHGRWGYQARVMGSCRPHQRLIFSGSNHHYITRLDVRHDRYVVYSGGYHRHHWVSMDGLIYAPYGGGHRMGLYNGWRNYGGSYRHATYLRRGPVCVLGGLIRGHWSHHITTLPRGCRPRRRLIFGANVHNHNARVDVLPDGRVLYINRRSRYGWLSLSGIHFVAYR